MRGLYIKKTGFTRIAWRSAFVNLAMKEAENSPR